jgi:hypothetical protein
MRQRKDCPNTDPLVPVEHWEIITGIQGEVYFQPNFLIFKKQKRLMRSLRCLSVSVFPP